MRAPVATDWGGRRRKTLLELFPSGENLSGGRVAFLSGLLILVDD